MFLNLYHIKNSKNFNICKKLKEFHIVHLLLLTSCLWIYNKHPFIMILKI